MPDNPIQTAGEELNKLLSQLQKIMEMMEAQQKAIKAELKASLKENIDNARFKSLTEHQTKITDQLAEANKLAQEQNKQIEALIKNQNNAQGQTQNGPANAVTGIGQDSKNQDLKDPAKALNQSSDIDLDLNTDSDIKADNQSLSPRPRAGSVAEALGDNGIETKFKADDIGNVSLAEMATKTSSNAVGVGV